MKLSKVRSITALAGLSVLAVVITDKLGEMISVRAVSHLLRLVCEDRREEAFSRIIIGFRESTALLPEYESHLTPVAYALYRIGPAALPAIKEKVNEGFERDGRPHRADSILIEILRAIEGRSSERQIKRSRYKLSL